jgi:uncharacterized membrane protein (DUF2068 family)
MAESSTAASKVLIALLVLEGLAGLLVSLLNVVTSRALGQDFLPWESSVIPAGFGVLCLLAAYGLARSQSWGVALAAVSQLLILAAGVYGLVDNPQTIAYVVLAIGLMGLLLLNRTTRRV